MYVTDENTLGLGKLLDRLGREDVVFPGHARLTEVPAGTPDLDWMPVIAHLDLVVVTRDRCTPRSSSDSAKPSQRPPRDDLQAPARPQAEKRSPRGWAAIALSGRHDRSRREGSSGRPRTLVIARSGSLAAEG